jgi:hypothetical protein
VHPQSPLCKTHGAAKRCQHDGCVKLAPGGEPCCTLHAKLLSAEAADPQHAAALYGDEKVANREIRVWRGATEKGP